MKVVEAVVKGDIIRGDIGSTFNDKVHTLRRDRPFKIYIYYIYIYIKNEYE